MQYTHRAADVAAEVSKAVFGKPQTIRTIWMAMLAGGHVLIEDIPGVGKTTLALAFARALELNESRVQFTLGHCGLYRVPEGDRATGIPPRQRNVQPVFG